MELKIVTYNIDGLPETLDLNDLPWILKPIAWIYKLFKGTTVITINDGGNKNENIINIGKWLESTDADIIGIQEDFNYHSELMQPLWDIYDCCTYTGGFDLSKIFSSAEWLTCFPFPRFKADGINLIYKDSRIKTSNEDIVRWKKSYGYFTHANDKLTHKGFRYYSATIDANTTIDIYVLHMDADFYHPEEDNNVSGDIKARKRQLQQLTEYILDKNSPNPSIILGDTNSTDRYSWDRDNIQDYLIRPINSKAELYIREAIPTNWNDVDRMFYINNTASPYNIEVKECSYGDVYYSDHRPFMTTFSIEYKAT